MDRIDTANSHDWLSLCARRSLAHLLPQLEQAGFSEETCARALHSLQYALRLPQAWPMVRTFIARWAPVMERSGHRQEWLELLQIALVRCQTEADGATEALILFHLAVILRMQVRHQESEAAFQASAARYEALGDRRGWARVRAHHAYLAWERREFTRALQLVAEAQAELAHSPDDETLAYCHLVRAAVAYERQEWEEAYREEVAAYTLWEQTGTSRLAAMALMNQALILQHMGQPEVAISVYQQALDRFQALGDIAGWATAQLNLGLLHANQARYREALTCYRRAEQVFQRLNDSLRLARIYNNVGEVYRYQQHWEEAEAAYRLSLSCWSQVDHLAGLVNTLDNLGFVLSAQGRHQEALEVLQEALDRLPQMADDPAYPDLKRTVTEKWHRAQEGLHAGEAQETPGHSHE